MHKITKVLFLAVTVSLLAGCYEESIYYYDNTPPPPSVRVYPYPSSGAYYGEPAPVATRSHAHYSHAKPSVGIKLPESDAHYGNPDESEGSSAHYGEAAPNVTVTEDAGSSAHYG